MRALLVIAALSHGQPPHLHFPLKFPSNVYTRPPVPLYASIDILHLQTSVFFGFLYYPILSPFSFSQFSQRRLDDSVLATSPQAERQHASIRLFLPHPHKGTEHSACPVSRLSVILCLLVRNHSKLSSDSISIRTLPSPFHVPFTLVRLLARLTLLHHNSILYIRLFRYA